jgi:hypothetical protein
MRGAWWLAHYFRVVSHRELTSLLKRFSFGSHFVRRRSISGNRILDATVPSRLF